MRIACAELQYITEHTWEATESRLLSPHFNPGRPADGEFSFALVIHSKVDPEQVCVSVKLSPRNFASSH
jgi:hypothetical protein